MTGDTWVQHRFPSKNEDVEMRAPSRPPVDVDVPVSEDETSSGLSTTDDEFDVDDNDDDGLNMANIVVTTGPVRQVNARRRTHEARFVCDICGTALTTKRNLEGASIFLYPTE
jgi:hypothetical protein